ncbi:unnamed protein product [Moneuplotes crassus]|uniref:EF-hand domain-containing protein n=1 Tax=Euplotes crassus TaxID=5936 RepID=A0AAD1Y5S2_EUPCR|nr:unnamed protein product [Moneuplotes crassus]
MYLEEDDDQDYNIDFEIDDEVPELSNFNEKKHFNASCDGKQSPLSKPPLDISTRKMISTQQNFHGGFDDQRRSFQNTTGQNFKTQSLTKISFKNRGIRSAIQRSLAFRKRRLSGSRKRNSRNALLLEEKQSLKQDNHHLKDENVKLKTRVLFLDKEIGKRNKLVEQTMMSKNISIKPKKASMIMKSSLVNTLKSKVRERDEIICKLRNEVEASKKDMKKTNINELITTVDILTEECTRLRGLLKQSLKREENFQQIEKENCQLVDAFQRKENEVDILTKNIYELNLNIEKQENTITNLNKVKKLVRDKDKAILKLKKELKTATENSKAELHKLQSDLQDSKRSNEKLKSNLANLQNKVRELENKITELEQFKMNDDLDRSVSEINIARRDSNYSQRENHSCTPASPVKNQKKIIDTGSSYPHGQSYQSIYKNKSEEELTDQSKAMTLPPPAKPISEISSAILQFRSVLRISDVGVKEFLDFIIFKDNSQSLKFSDFKLRAQEIMKNYTQDFACFCFNSQPIISREDLEQLLSSEEVYFKLDDYLKERVEQEFSSCKMALKESFDIEDTKSQGFVSVKQYEEILRNLDITLDQDLFEFSILLMFDKHLSVDMLDYPKLFDEYESPVVQDNTRELSSIKEDSKEENLMSKKKIDSTEKKEKKSSTPRNIDSIDFNSRELKLEDDDSVSNANGEVISRDSVNDLTDRMMKSEDDINQQLILDTDSLTEQQILDIAEHVFEKTFCKMKEKFTLDSLYSDKLEECEYNGKVVQTLSPEHFIQSFQTLGIAHLEEIEIECLLKVLVKSEIGHKILFEDLVMILENFGVS